MIKNNGTWEYNGYLRFRYDYTFCTGITRYCEWMDFRYVLDAGCGAGILVAALRRMGLIASGIDSNPYTPELSARLLSENDSPCQIMDLTDEISSDTQFDLVLCLDVLQYIPVYGNRKVYHLVIEKCTTFQLPTKLGLIQQTSK